MGQREKLYELLNYVHEHTAFYKENIDSGIKENLTAEDLDKIFQSIPIVDKSIIRHRLRDFIDDSVRCAELEDALDLNKDFLREYQYRLNGKNVISEYTSGSSGIPFISLKSVNERLFLGNYTWKLRKRFYPVSQREMFNFIHNFGEKSYAFPFEYVDDPEEASRLELNYLCEKKYKWWHLHQAKMAQYADYLEKNPRNLDFLEVIENNGSFLGREERKKYEEVFQARIVDNYGCREVWTIGYECRDGHMHANDECLIFELVDDENHVITESGIEGNVVVTSLVQKTMPFIRYKIGDRAYYTDESCEVCGSRTFRLVPKRAKIYGTEWLGNQMFGKVIQDLTLYYKLHRFEQISVIQRAEKLFEVNIRANHEDRKVLEDAFRAQAFYYFHRSDYEFEFTYREDYHPKSLFLLSMKD